MRSARACLRGGEREREREKERESRCWLSRHLPNTGKFHLRVECAGEHEFVWLGQGRCAGVDARGEAGIGRGVSVGWDLGACWHCCLCLAVGSTSGGEV